MASYGAHVADQPATENRRGLRRIIATVSLSPEDRKRVSALIAQLPGLTPERLQQTLDDRFSPDRMHLCVSLGAELDEGAVVSSGTTDMAIGGLSKRDLLMAASTERPSPEQSLAEARRIHGPDVMRGASTIDEYVDQLLGRDPTLHRPPRLAWGTSSERSVRPG